MTEYSKDKGLWKDFELSPPASAEELAWWRERRKSVRNWQLVVQGLPFLVVFSIVAVFKANMVMLVTMPLVAILVGVMFWWLMEGFLRNKYITYKRIREDLGLPDEPGPPEKGLMP